MKQKKKETDIGLESVKIKRGVVNKVRDNKKKNDTPIGIFFEKAALKELAHLELKESEKV